MKRRANETERRKERREGKKRVRQISLGKVTRQFAPPPALALYDSKNKSPVSGCDALQHSKSCGGGPREIAVIIMFKMESWSGRVETEMMEEVAKERRERRERSKSRSRKVSFSPQRRTRAKDLGRNLNNK